MPTLPPTIWNPAYDRQKKGKSKRDPPTDDDTRPIPGDMGSEGNLIWQRDGEIAPLKATIGASVMTSPDVAFAGSLVVQIAPHKFELIPHNFLGHNSKGLKAPGKKQVCDSPPLL